MISTISFIRIGVCREVRPSVKTGNPNKYLSSHDQTTQFGRQCRTHDAPLVRSLQLYPEEVWKEKVEL